MRYTKLGASGLDVSVLCLGAMTFGETGEGSNMQGVGCDEATSHRILDAALDAGVNFVDTADVYGDGLSERVIGRWIASRKRRDDVVLATKFRMRTTPGPNGAGASRRRIVRSVEDSLRRLQTDHVDLYQIHMQDDATPVEETLRALDDLVRQGKVLYVGASNHAAWRLVDSLWTSRTLGLSRYVSLQMQYSLVERGVEREHLPACAEHGVGLVAWSPLAGGFLTGKYHRGQGAPEGTRLEKWYRWYRQFDDEQTWGLVEVLREVAADLGATPAQVALAWVLHRPAVSSVIFGARSTEQLADNLPAGDLVLSDEVVRRLDDASSVAAGYPYDMIRRYARK